MQLVHSRVSGVCPAAPYGLDIAPQYQSKPAADTTLTHWLSDTGTASMGSRVTTRVDHPSLGYALKPHQQQALGNLMRVRALVAQQAERLQQERVNEFLSAAAGGDVLKLQLVSIVTACAGMNRIKHCVTVLLLRNPSNPFGSGQDCHPCYQCCYCVCHEWWYSCMSGGDAAASFPVC
jgi:hypothetical protein